MKPIMRINHTGNAHLADGKYAICDLVDIELLRELFDKFTKATNFTIGFLDHPGLKILISTGWRDICTGFHRSSPATADYCVKSNRHLMDQLDESGKIVVAQCDNGLVDCATPIIVNGKHIASLATGQIFLEKPDIERFSRQAKQFGFDENEYLKAVKKVPVISEEILKNMTAFLGEMALVISNMGYTGLKMREETDRLEREIEERKWTEEALRKSEERFRAIFNQAAVGVAQTETATGRILHVNQRYCDLLGLPMDAVASNTFMDFTHPDDLQKDLDCMEQLKAGTTREFTLEKRFVKSDGTTIWCNLTVSPMWDQGETPNYHIAVVEDITKRKKAEESLKSANQRRKILMDTSLDGIAIINQHHKVVEANHRFAEMLGYAMEEVLDLHTWDFEAIMTEAQIRSNFIDLTKTNTTFQTKHRRKDGTIYDVEVCATGALVLNEPMVLTISRDITVRKSAEEALRQSEAKYRALIETTDTGYLILDENGTVMDANQEYIRLSGHKTLDEIIGRNVTEWTAKHDYDRSAQEVKKCIEKGFVKNLSIDYADKDGKLTPIEVNAKIVKTDEGLRILSLCRDITERTIGYKIQNTQLRLIESVVGKSVIESLRIFLDEAELITGSQIGFYHFVEDDQKTVSLQTWSTNTLVNMCSAGSDRLHYPISQAGVWVDCVREGRPVIHNDYASLAHRKGLPEGHAPVARELVVPVIREGKIKAILGVGNKNSEYDRFDVEMVQQFADRAWEMIMCKIAEEKTKQSEQFLDAIVENIPNMLFVKDAKELRFVRFNKAGEELIGHCRKDIIGKNDYDFFPRDVADFFTNKDREVLNIGKLIDITDEPIQTRDKGERRLHTKKIPILDENGQPKYLLGISEDITERIKSEERIRQTQKMESIGSLASGIAHDLNNILFPISGLSEMLLVGMTSDIPAYESIEQIHKSAQRGSDLVKQILAFSRQSITKKMPIRIQPILKEVLKLIRATITTSIEITTQIKPECGMIFADPTQIHQIMMNMITNAYHAVEKNGGTIHIELKESALVKDDLLDNSIKSGRYACITVSDTGTGIEHSIIDKIFDPYFTTKEHGKGTGLGLAVVHGIVKDHGGVINVTSEVGKGSTFTVYLPIIEDIKEKKTATDSNRYSSGTESILLVDDEEPIAKMMKMMLEMLGYRVAIRVSSPDALEAFKTNSSKFDLVISDRGMPNMTGEQLAFELISIRADIPIILCTGFSEENDEIRAMEMGIKGVLKKPVAMGNLSDMVRKVLDDCKKST